MGVKRFAAAIAVACALLGSVAASGVGASVPARARVQGLVCQHALEPPARAMSITAVMRPVKGTRRMQLRFQLLEVVLKVSDVQFPHVVSRTCR